MITSEPAVSMTNIDDMVTVTGSQVNIRSSATTASQSLGTVSQGETLKRTGKGDSWSRVVYNGKEAYISNRYITAKAAGQGNSPAADQQSGETIQNSSPGNQASSETVTFNILLEICWNFLRFPLAQPHYTRSTAAVKKNHVTVSMPDTAPRAVPV